MRRAAMWWAFAEPPSSEFWFHGLTVEAISDLRRAEFGSRQQDHQACLSAPPGFNVRRSSNYGDASTNSASWATSEGCIEWTIDPAHQLSLQERKRRQKNQRQKKLSTKSVQPCEDGTSYTLCLRLCRCDGSHKPWLTCCSHNCCLTG